MASASSFFRPAVPSLRRRNSPSKFIYGYGFYSPEGISIRVQCSSTTEGAESINSTATQSRVTRLVSKGCKLVGCGSAVPKFQVSNDDLAKLVQTSDEWISVRTGIRNRRVLTVPFSIIGSMYFSDSNTLVTQMVNGLGLTYAFTGNDSLTGLATEAAKKALEMAKVDPDDVDLILLCTSTPEDLFGSATQIQKALGCKKNPLAYDITAACSGFILGLVSGSCYIRGGGFKNVLVIGAEVISRYLDWTDRETCILFGDAAGAVLLQACDSEDDGLFSFDLHSDGDGQRHLNAAIKEDKAHDDVALSSSNGSVLGFPPRQASYQGIYMNGKEVFRFAVQVVPNSIELALQKAGLTCSSIDWLLLHQANQRIIDNVATRLQFPSERVISNLVNYGNTSAASIPLALDEAVRSGKVKPGHMIAAAGFGAGLTWGSVILRWG